MLGLSEIRQTKVYQDAIAEILNLPVETVTEILANLDRDEQ